MGLDVSEVLMVKVQLKLDGEYVSGQRLKITFEDGEEAYFQQVVDMFTPHSDMKPVLLLDERLTSRKIIDRSNRRHGAFTEAGWAEVDDQTRSYPELLSVLGIDPIMVNDRTFITIEHKWEDDALIIGQPLNVWVKTVGSSSASGSHLYGTVAVKSVEVLILSDLT